MFVISSCQTKPTSCCFPRKTSSASGALCLYTTHIYVLVLLLIIYISYLLWDSVEEEKKKSTVLHQNHITINYIE